MVGLRSPLKIALLMLAAATLFAAASPAVSAEDGPTVIAKIRVGWGGYNPQGVAVNPTTNRIYTANIDSDSVSVIDGGANTVVATVPIGSDFWGVAVNPNTNLIYTANAWSSSVSVVDGGTNTVVATVPVGSSPQGMAVNPNTNRIYTDR